jgi:hypothetical protein
MPMNGRSGVMVRARDIFRWSLLLVLVNVSGNALATPPEGGDQLVVEPGVDAPEEVVDDQGALYKKRPYGGIIPAVRDHFDEGPKSAGEKAPEPIINWIGYQQRMEVSSVFVQFDRVAAIPYRVYKPSDERIVVDIPGATLPLRNDRRELETDGFPGNVLRIHGRMVKSAAFSGARVTITLRKVVPYNYYERDEYLFIDIER